MNDERFTCHGCGISFRIGDPVKYTKNRNCQCSHERTGGRCGRLFWEYVQDGHKPVILGMRREDVARIRRGAA